MNKKNLWWTIEDRLGYLRIFHLSTWNLLNEWINYSTERRHVLMKLSSYNNRCRLVCNFHLVRRFEECSPRVIMCSVKPSTKDFALDRGELPHLRTKDLPEIQWRNQRPTSRGGPLWKMKCGWNAGPAPGWKICFTRLVTSKIRCKFFFIRWVHFCGTSQDISYFNSCGFELAIT
jgi:hypothetical protein